MNMSSTLNSGFFSQWMIIVILTEVSHTQLLDCSTDWCQPFTAFSVSHAQFSQEPLECKLRQSHMTWQQNPWVKLALIINFFIKKISTFSSTTLTSPSYSSKCKHSNVTRDVRPNKSKHLHNRMRSLYCEKPWKAKRINLLFRGFMVSFLLFSFFSDIFMGFFLVSTSKF